MNFTDFRLKIRHFFRRNKKLIFVIFIVWAIIFFINFMLGRKKPDTTPKTTYEPHVSVMDSNVSTPKSLQDPIEDMIKQYVDACNDGNYQKAFDMLSEDCRKYGFSDNVENFMKHVLVKMPMPRRYAIQDYSTATYGKQKMYIYDVKYTEDILATGLTNSTYAYTSEKFVFYENDDGDLLMNVGNYLYHEELNKIAENEYLKINVDDKVVDYEIEKYNVRFTNRSNYTIVISDGMEDDEIVLVLPNEVRRRAEIDHIVLKPGDDFEMEMTFPKFADDGDISQSINFSQVRVMETYSGTEGVDESIIQTEINNAISKFSMEVQTEN